MKRNTMQRIICAGGLFLAFALFTCLVARFDVQPIGPEGTWVGFATVNQFIVQRLGAHRFWYGLTRWMGAAAVLVAGGFGVAGLCQLIRRKNIKKVDRRILALGAVYALMAAFYLLFEVVVINCRPVIVEGGPEASYPSSHVLLVVCIMATTAKQIRARWPDRRGVCRWADRAALLLGGLTALGRLASGVHWFTDIVGGVLLAAALTALYDVFAGSEDH